MKKILPDKYQEILNLMRQEILADFRKDSCIASTRILIDVMKEFDVRVRPLPVTAVIGNGPMARRVEKEGWPDNVETTIKWGEEDGSYCLGIGFGGDPEPGKFPGHLVGITSHYLIDLSIDQADRPQWNIIVPPILRALEPGFVIGKSRLVCKGYDDNEEVTGFVVYDAQPWNTSYKSAPDWKLIDRTRPVTQRIIKRLRAL